MDVHMDVPMDVHMDIHVDVLMDGPMDVHMTSFGSRKLFFSKVLGIVFLTPNHYRLTSW